MPRVGYLLNQYPAISHSFILREVRALRELGVEIDTFSIHRSDPAHLLAAPDLEEFHRTYALRPLDHGQFVAAHLGALRVAPRSYLRALWRSLSLARGPRDTVWQLFYFLEAVPIWAQVARAGLRHVHAHFTSPAADVAMIVAELGDADGAWSWSFSAHGADIQETDQRRLAEKIRSATRVVCVSDYGRSQLMTLVEPQHWPKLRVVYCGVDPREFSAASRDGTNPARVLTVGRLVPVKGHALLLEAVALARDRGIDLSLTLVGDGPLRSTLQDDARRLGIDDRVEFTGTVGQDEIGAYYQQADMFCLPSLREGVPVVLMEAMASGLPVIASRIMGIPELVEDNVTGLLVSPGRPDSLAETIARLATDGRLRRRLGEAGRARIAADYNVRQSAQQMAAVLDEVVSPA